MTHGKHGPWLEPASPMYEYAIDKYLGIDPLKRIELIALQKRVEKLRRNSERIGKKSGVSF